MGTNPCPFYPRTWFDLIPILRDRDKMMEWFEDVGLVPRSKYCTKHKQNMVKYTTEGEFGYWLCRKSNKWNHRQSIATNTWFERCHVPPEVNMIITYSFARGDSFESAMKEASIYSTTISAETVSDRYSFCREVCMISLDEEYGEHGLIGGHGKIVEIDECKIGRRKYERGRVVEGSWIFGMIERGSNEYRLEICPDNSRSELTLLELIRKHIAPGTTIHSDCWRGYINLESHGYKHLTVNHSQNFVDPETGCNTQSIESNWRPLRRFLSRGGIRHENLDAHLCEFLWRRNVKKKGLEPFEKLIKDKLRYIVDRKSS